MGLLSIWEDYWKKNELSDDGTYGSSADLSNRTKLRRGQSERSNLNTAGGVPTGNLVPRQHVRRGQSVNQGIPSHMDPKYVPKNRMGKEYPEASAADIAAGKSIKLASGKNIVSPGKQAQVLAQSADKTPLGGGQNKIYQDAIMQGGKGANIPQDMNWWQKLSGMFNSKFDMDSAMASWKDKGGFEGLMANPAFTMGLAFMQAGAEGKSLGQGALDNVMKAGGISQHYKKIIEDRKQEPIQATAGDIDEVKSLLKTMNVDDPGWHEKLWGKLKGKNVQMKFDIAAEDIALEMQKEMTRLQEANKGKKPLVFGYREKEKILKRLLREGKFKKKVGTWFTAGTLESDVGGSFPEPMAKGGPIQAGKPYLVGEEGPEVVIPHSDGNVLSNDDSQIYAMLLASNPQLQKVSRTRAEKILKSRIPEYFE